MRSALLHKKAFTGFPGEVEILEKSGDRLFEVDSLRVAGQRMLVAVAKDGSKDYPVYNEESEKVKWQQEKRFTKKFRDAVKKHMKSEVEEAETPDEVEEATNDPALRSGAPKAAGKYQYTVRMKCNNPECGHSWYDPQYEQRLTFCPMCGGKDFSEIPKGVSNNSSPRTAAFRDKKEPALEKQIRLFGEPISKWEIVFNHSDKGRYHFISDKYKLMTTGFGSEKILLGYADSMRMDDEPLKMMAERYNKWKTTGKTARMGKCQICKQQRSLNRDNVCHECEQKERDAEQEKMGSLKTAERIWNPYPAGAYIETETLPKFTVHDLKGLVDKLRDADPMSAAPNAHQRAIRVCNQLMKAAKDTGAKDLLKATRHYLSTLERLEQYSKPGDNSALYHQGINHVPPRTKRALDRAFKLVESSFTHFVR